MPRHPVGSTLLLLPAAAVAMAILPVACSSGGAEEQLINTFVRAARARDNVTLGNISAVSFNPNRDGVIERFSVTDVGPEQRRSVDLRQLSAAHEHARQEEEAFSLRQAEFQSANIEAITRADKVRRSGQPIRGQDAEVTAALEQWRDEHREHSRRVSETEARLNSDRAQAMNSLSPVGVSDADLSEMEVDLVSKKITVAATVRTPAGETEDRTLVFTLQRAVGTHDGQVREGRWIITDLE